MADLENDVVDHEAAVEAVAKGVIDGGESGLIELHTLSLLRIFLPDASKFYVTHVI